MRISIPGLGISLSVRSRILSIIPLFDVLVGLPHMPHNYIDAGFLVFGMNAVVHGIDHT